MKPYKTKNSSGFTLIEMIVTLMIFTLSISLWSTLFASGITTWANINEGVKAHQSARFALNNIKSRIKEFPKNEIYIVENGERILLGKDINFCYDIRLFGLSPKDLRINNYPYASNIKELKLSYKKFSSPFNSSRDLMIMSSTKDDDWDIIKIELTTISSEYEYKVTTYVLPEQNYTFGEQNQK